MAEYAKKEILIEKLLQIVEDFEKSGGLMQVIFATGLKALVDSFNYKECGFFEEAKPIVHAHWVTDFDFDPEEEQELYFYFCSKCKNELYGDNEDFKYCPYCGAQMDEEE